MHTTSHSFHKKQFIMSACATVGMLCAVFAFPFGLSALTTQTPQVNLNFSVPIYINSIRLSNYANFQDAITVPYTMGTPVSWNICHGRSSCNSGTYYVYADFLKDGNSIRIASNLIEYRRAPLPLSDDDNDTPPPVETEEDQEPIPEPVEETPVVDPVPPVIEEPLPVPVIPPVIETPTIVVEKNLDPIVETAAQAVQMVGVGTAVVATVAPVLGTVSSISELIMVILRAWNALLVFVGLRRRNKPWGVVYDSTTKQPLDPAYVSLLDKDGNEVATSITDINGRYGFLVPAGTYRMSAGKTKYQFPSSNMAGRTSDVLYDDLYFGQEITIKKGEVITKNIPMDTQQADWNQQEKQRMGVGRVSGISMAVDRIVTVAFYFGFIVTLIMTVRELSAFNIVLCLVYLGMALLRALGVRPRSYGVLKMQKTKTSIGNAIIKVFSKGLDREVAHAVSDASGRYYSLVPKGEYYLKVEKKVSDEQYQEIFTSHPIKTDRGIINKSFEV